MSYQHIVLCGNLGGDPEMRYLPSGTQVTNFSLATNEAWVDKQTGEKQERTTWWRISVWGAQAEACANYLHKGRQVLVEGQMVTDERGNPRVWQRQDGTWGASFELKAQKVKFLGGRGDGGNGRGYDDDGSDYGEYDEHDAVPF